MVVPHEAVAGLKRRHFEHFAAYEDMTQHATPVAHCWTPAGEVYVGCAAGQLLKVRGRGREGGKEIICGVIKMSPAVVTAWILLLVFQLGWEKGRVQKKLGTI